MLGKLRKLVRLPGRDVMLLAEAAVSLTVAKLSLILVPFRRIAPRLGETMAESPSEDPADPELPRRVGWAVAVASRHLPWSSRCLAQAMAGKSMLLRRELSSTLYLGLAKGEQADLDAHAWLRCGSRILIGEKVSEGYAVIASFAEVETDEVPGPRAGD
jgi:hypothetical protein